MSLAVLRASGESFDIEAFIDQHHLRCEATWRVGEPDRRGRLATTSGFSVAVAEASVEADLIQACASWLVEQRGMLAALAAAGATAHLDLAVFPTEPQPAVSVVFTQEIMALCVQLGVTLEVSAYASIADAGDAS